MEKNNHLIGKKKGDLSRVSTSIPSLRTTDLLFMFALKHPAQAFKKTSYCRVFMGKSSAKRYLFGLPPNVTIKSNKNKKKKTFETPENNPQLHQNISKPNTSSIKNNTNSPKPLKTTSKAPKKGPFSGFVDPLRQHRLSRLRIIAAT